MNKFYIHLTDKAIEAFNRRIEERNTPDVRIRLGVQGGGCSGMKYVIQFDDDKPKENDLQFFHNGIRVIVDPKSIVYLNGCELDFEKTLVEEGFVFSNPQEAKRCGCGKSFSI